MHSWNMYKHNHMGFVPELGHLVWEFCHPNHEKGIEEAEAAKEAKEYSFGSYGGFGTGEEQNGFQEWLLAGYTWRKSPWYR